MDRLHFQTVVDGLWNKGLTGRLSASLLSALKDKGLDLSKPLAPAYPAEQFRDWIRLTAAALYPGDAPDDALRKLGVDSFRGFVATGLGEAMKGMLLAVGTRRGLERMQHNLRNGNNYMETRAKDLDGGALELWLKDANGLPAYYAGMFEEGALATGATDIRCTWTLDGAACTYRFAWKEPAR